MKIKIISIFSILFLICGCTNIKDQTIEDIIAPINSKIEKENTYNTGYKYYLPVGLAVDKNTLYNNIIKDNKYTYYLYVDVISYFNKKEINYQIKEDKFYSQKLDKGYIEITEKENNQYLIEIMYNYAKIEVIVGYDDINIALNYSVSILRSIEYNDIIIENLLEKDILNYQEEEYNIFDTTSSDSNVLKYEESLNEENNEPKIKDEDLIS